MTACILLEGEGYCWIVSTRLGGYYEQACLSTTTCPKRLDALGKGLEGWHTRTESSIGDSQRESEVWNVAEAG